MTEAAAVPSRAMGDRVLLVEDDRELGSQIVSRLAAAGYTPTWWQDGRRVLVSDVAGVALVILDLMLPGRYGMDMLKDIRDCSDVPVMVLSARNDASDKVRALKLGADDYMTKPFWPDELLERVRARLRRPTLQRGDLLDVGGLQIDLVRHEARIDGRTIELTPVEFAFVEALARRPGVALTRAWLAEHVLDPERDGTERTLDVHVSRLRKKLDHPGLIETVWGIGYRLAVGDDAASRKK